MDSKELFENTPPRKLFFKAALPGSVAMLASTLYALLDGIFVGQVLGETAFAAVNLAISFIVLNFAISDFIASGSAVLISVSLGKKENDKANNAFTCAILMIFLSSIFVGVSLYLLAPWMIGAMGAEGELLEFAVKYLRVYASCAPLTTLMFAMDNFWRISGKIKQNMELTVVANALVVGLDVLFLMVLDLGVTSTALAACIGTAICVVIYLIPFIRNKYLLKFVRPRFSFELVAGIFKNGLPAFLYNIASRVSAIAMNSALMRMGGEAAVASYGVLMYIMDTINMLIYGMCDALQPAIGYNWGAKNIKRVMSIEKCCMTASATVSLIGMGAMLFFNKALVSAFVSPDDVEIFNMATHAMVLFSFVGLTRWIVASIQLFFTAIEKPKNSSLIAVVSTCVMPLIIITALWRVGLDGLWLNGPINLFVVAVMSVIMFVTFLKKISKNAENVA